MLGLPVAKPLTCWDLHPYSAQSPGRWAWPTLQIPFALSNFWAMELASHPAWEQSKLRKLLPSMRRPGHSQHPDWNPRASGGSLQPPCTGRPQGFPQVMPAPSWPLDEHELLHPALSTSGVRLAPGLGALVLA